MKKIITFLSCSLMEVIFFMLSSFILPLFLFVTIVVLFFVPSEFRGDSFLLYALMGVLFQILTSLFFVVFYGLCKRISDNYNHAFPLIANWHVNFWKWVILGAKD